MQLGGAVDLLLEITVLDTSELVLLVLENVQLNIPSMILIKE